MTNTTTKTGSQTTKTANASPKCNGIDHWTRSRTGRPLWSVEDECIVHGTGREWR